MREFRSKLALLTSTLRSALVLLTGTLFSACAGLAPTPSAGEAAASIEASITELYAAFCFDAGGEAQWDQIEAHFLESAIIVNPYPVGAHPTVVSRAQFLKEFQTYVRSDSVRDTGLHERVLAIQADHYGNLAHAYVSFEGFVPATGVVRTRGLDSLQLVRDGARWRVASFTTQYETEGLVLPARFVNPD